MPIHHEVTSLPAQTLEEFTAASGGELQPKTTTTLREFEGCPGPYNRDRQLPSTALHPDSSSYKTNGQGVAGGMSKTSTISQPHGMSKTDSMNMADSTSKADGMSKTDSLGKSGNLNTSDSMNNTDSYGDTQAQEGNYTYGDKLGKMAGVAVGASGAGAAAATAAGSSVGGKTGSGLQQAGKTVEAAKVCLLYY